MRSIQQYYASKGWEAWKCVNPQEGSYQQHRAPPCVHYKIVAQIPDNVTWRKWEIHPRGEKLESVSICNWIWQWGVNTRLYVHKNVTWREKCIQGFRSFQVCQSTRGISSTPSTIMSSFIRYLLQSQKLNGWLNEKMQLCSQVAVRISSASG